MTAHLITGHAGEVHVNSGDVGAFNAAIFGNGTYILSGCDASMTDATTFKINDGEILAEGRHVRITDGGQTATIESGQSGYNRNDIVALKYSKNSSGVESVSLYVKKGTAKTGTPSDPSMPSSGKVLNGSSVAYWPLYRVQLNGLTPSAPVMIANDFSCISAAKTWTLYERKDSGTCGYSVTAGFMNPILSYIDTPWGNEKQSGSVDDRTLSYINPTFGSSPSVKIVRGGTYRIRYKWTVKDCGNQAGVLINVGGYSEENLSHFEDADFKSSYETISADLTMKIASGTTISVKNYCSKNYQDVKYGKSSCNLEITYLGD